MQLDGGFDCRYTRGPPPDDHQIMVARADITRGHLPARRRSARRFPCFGVGVCAGRWWGDVGFVRARVRRVDVSGACGCRRIMWLEPVFPSDGL